MAWSADHSERSARRWHLVKLVRFLHALRRFQRQGPQLRAGARCSFAKYLVSVDPNERKKLAEEIQREILEHYYFVPVFRHAAVQAFGTRIAAARWQEVFPTITTAYAYPWEDIELKG